MEAESAADPSGINDAVIRGELIAEPELRTLPSGTAVLSFSLTVRRAKTKTTSVPLAWYDPPKRAGRWRPGDHVVARGSVARRFFQSQNGLGSVTEVVVDAAELAHHVRAERLLGAWGQVASSEHHGDASTSPEMGRG